MVRVYAAPVYTQRSLIGAAILVLLAVAALLLVRQSHQSAAADTGHTVHSLAAPLPSSSVSSESPVPGDSFSPPPAENTGTSSSHTSLTVNGQAVPLPANGTVDQTLTDGDTTTTISAETSSSSDSRGGSAGTNSSSVNIQVNTHSERGL